MEDELLYSQKDIDGVLAVVREAEKEAELSRQMLWAVVRAAGGEVVVPHKLWIEAGPGVELTFWDDLANYTMHVRAENCE